MRHSNITQGSKFTDNPIRFRVQSSTVRGSFRQSNTVEGSGYMGVLSLAAHARGVGGDREQYRAVQFSIPEQLLSRNMDDSEEGSYLRLIDCCIIQL